MDFDHAFAFASKKRPVIFPNMGFQKQLKEFEKLLVVKRQYAIPRVIDKNKLKDRSFSIGLKGAMARVSKLD